MKWNQFIHGDCYDVMAEIDAYAIPVIDVLREEGYVEAVIRRRLAPFYKSAAARKILQQEA